MSRSERSLAIPGVLALALWLRFVLLQDKSPAGQGSPGPLPLLLVEPAEAVPGDPRCDAIRSHVRRSFAGHVQPGRGEPQDLRGTSPSRADEGLLDRAGVPHLHAA